jgi:hypothetical protein
VEVFIISTSATANVATGDTVRAPQVYQAVLVWFLSSNVKWNYERTLEQLAIMSA